MLPDSKPVYTDGLERVKKTVDLKGRTLQMFVRISEITLEPGQTFDASDWTVEGGEAVPAALVPP